MTTRDRIETCAVRTSGIRDLIAERRTIFEFKPESVPLSDLERIFEAGIWAPNHRLTEPWRFTLIGEKTRAVLARRYSEIQKEKGLDMSAEAQEKRARAGLNKFLSKPTVVVTSCLQVGDEQRRREDYAATCCAMQNIQLAAWDAGVGMQWSTGPITREEQTYELLGIDSACEYIIGFFYVGYPKKISGTRRKAFSEVFRATA